MVGYKRKRQDTTSDSEENSCGSCCSDDDYDDASSGGQSSSSYTSYTDDVDSSSESAQSESVSEAPQLPLAKLANLSFNHIFQADEDSSSEEHMYQRRGRSTARLAASLKQRCCKGRCKRNLKPIWKSVCYLVACFWALSKPGQDGLLWSLQNPMFYSQSEDDDPNEESEDTSFSARGHSPRVLWHFEGALLQDHCSFLSSSPRILPPPHPNQHSGIRPYLP